MSGLPEEKVEKTLKALIHPVRRRILKGLAENKSMSYTEMMKYAGIDDSGTFAFHLRNLQGLVEKDERGEYRLTSEGWKAYNALKQLDFTLEEEIEKPVVEKVREVEKEKVVTLSDRLNVEVDEKMLLTLKSKREKLFITDVVTVTIHRVPQKLLDEVLEGIMDCIVVNVPEELYSALQLKCKDVLSINKYRDKPPKSPFPTALAGIASTIGTLASEITTSILKGIFKGVPITKKVKTITLDLKEEVKKPYKLVLRGDGGGLKVESVEDDVASARVEVRDREDASLKWVVDGVLKATIEEGDMKLKAPVGVKVLDANLESGALTLDLKDPNIEECKVGCDSGSTSISLEEYSAKKTLFTIDSGTLSSRIAYKKYEGTAELEVKVDSGAATVTVEVPEDVGVKAELTSENGFSIVEVNGYKGGAYVDPNFQSATSKLVIRGEAISGALRVKVMRR